MEAVILYGQKDKKVCKLHAHIPLTLLHISQKTLKKVARRFNATTIEELFRISERKIERLQNKKIQGEIRRIKSKIISRIRRIKTTRSEYKTEGIFYLFVHALEKLLIHTPKKILDFLHRERPLNLSGLFLFKKMIK